MLSEGSGGRLASVDLSRSSMGGALGPDSIPDPVPGAGGVTIEGKCDNIVILEDRDDDDIGKHFRAMPRCLQTCVATNASNTMHRIMPLHACRPPTQPQIHLPHLPKTFNYILFI